MLLDSVAHREPGPAEIGSSHPPVISIKLEAMKAYDFDVSDIESTNAMVRL